MGKYQGVDVSFKILQSLMEVELCLGLRVTIEKRLRQFLLNAKMHMSASVCGPLVTVGIPLCVR